MSFLKLDKYLASLEKADIHSIECIVYRDHEPLFHKCYGYSDPEKTHPTSPSDLYWLFSCSKVITCLAAVKLIDEGKLCLDDPVSKYLPEYASLIVEENGKVSPAKNQMKIIHLFTMTGGLSYDFEAPKVTEFVANNPGAGTVDIVRALIRDPLIFEPGTHYRYSLCHDVLGAVIEVVSGKKLSEYLEENFFAPLGIKEIGFRPTEEQLKRFSATYTYDNKLNRARLIPTENRFRFNSVFESGGGGLFGNASEYVKILDAIACGGVCPNSHRIMSEKAVMMMTENRLDDQCLSDYRKSPRFFGYGWGLCGRVHMRPEVSCSLSPVGEFGWDGAAASFALIDPFNKLSIFCAMHTRGCSFAYEKIHPTIRNLVYSELLSENN